MPEEDNELVMPGHYKVMAAAIKPLGADLLCLYLLITRS